MPRIYRSSVIAAPVGRVWDFVRDFNGLPRWFPGVVRSQIEAGLPADQIGCTRDFELDGGRLRERLLALSDRDHTCTYTILEGPLPVSRYEATFRLFPITDGDRTFIDYAADFDCPADKEAEIVTILTGLFEGALGNLRRRFDQ